MGVLASMVEVALMVMRGITGLARQDGRDAADGVVGRNALVARMVAAACVATRAAMASTAEPEQMGTLVAAEVGYVEPNLKDMSLPGGWQQLAVSNCFERKLKNVGLPSGLEQLTVGGYIEQG